MRGLLRRWLERHDPAMAWLADLLDLANERLGDRHLGVGPSYFMGSPGELDESRARRIWKRAVIPYIEEQFFGNEDRLEEFDFDLLKSELPPAVFALPARLLVAGEPEDAEVDGYPVNGSAAGALAPEPLEPETAAADANASTA